MSQTIQATATDYITDASRFNGTNIRALFVDKTSGDIHRRKQVLVYAKMLAAEDGMVFTPAEWSKATGMIVRGQRKQTVLGPAKLAEMGEVIEVVCSLIGVDRAMLAGKSRHPDIVRARRLCAKAARATTVLSWPEIARAIGRPNHSTVVTACQRMDALIAGGDTDLAADLEKVLRAIGHEEAA